MGLEALLAEVATTHGFRGPATSLSLSALAQADWEQSAADAARASQGRRPSRAPPRIRAPIPHTKQEDDEDEEFFDAEQTPSTAATSGG